MRVGATVVRNKGKFNFLKLNKIIVKENEHKGGQSRSTKLEKHPLKAKHAPDESNRRNRKIPPPLKV